MAVEPYCGRAVCNATVEKPAHRQALLVLRIHFYFWLLQFAVAPLFLHNIPAFVLTRVLLWDSTLAAHNRYVLLKGAVD